MLLHQNSSLFHTATSLRSITPLIRAPLFISFSGILIAFPVPGGRDALQLLEFSVEAGHVVVSDGFDAVVDGARAVNQQSLKLVHAQTGDVFGECHPDRTL